MNNPYDKIDRMAARAKLDLHCMARAFQKQHGLPCPTIHEDASRLMALAKPFYPQ